MFGVGVRGSCSIGDACRDVDALARAGPADNARVAEHLELLVRPGTKRSVELKRELWLLD